jgi:glycosyltransferase involved in cell wall biosynthesis
MQRLLTGDDLRQIMGRRGQEKVRREYTWDQVAGRVLAVYRDVAN